MRFCTSWMSLVDTFRLSVRGDESAGCSSSALLPTAGDIRSALGSSDRRAALSRSGPDSRETDKGGCAGADAALAAPEVVGDGAALPLPAGSATADTAAGVVLPAASWACEGATVGDSRSLLLETVIEARRRRRLAQNCPGQSHCSIAALSLVAGTQLLYIFSASIR